MTVSSSARFSLTRWSAESDPVNRTQFDNDNATLDEYAMMFGQGLFNARPVSTPSNPGVPGRIYLAADTHPQQAYWDTGTGWLPMLPYTRGTNVIACDSNGMAVIDHNLGAIPSVFLVNISDTNGGLHLCSPVWSSLTATQATVQAWTGAGAASAGSNLRFGWVAYL